jgi:2-oxoisovalerate dehydrogenase E2 component (dihydrolipoyl transacylase)
LTPGEDRVVPIKGYTRAMLRTMTEANTIPHFGYCDDVVVDRLVDLRDQLKSMAADRGVRMSYMPLFIKVVCT